MEFCKVKMGDKVLPVGGSASGEPGKATGTCPMCETPGVVLSIVGGFVRRHKIASEAIPENNPQAGTLVVAPVRYGKFLSEPQVENVDHAGQAGDPSAALKRRTADLEGAHQAGTVKVPVKGPKGRAKLTEVPATETSVRAALGYWKARKPRTDASRVRQSAMVSELVRRLEAMRGATDVVHAPVDAPVTTDVPSVRQAKPTRLGAEASPEGHTRHMLTGPALVRGPNMSADPAKRRHWTNPVTGEREPAAAHLDGALTERLDKTVADSKPVAHRSASQRANYRKKMRRQARNGLVPRTF